MTTVPLSWHLQCAICPSLVSVRVCRSCMVVTTVPALMSLMQSACPLLVALCVLICPWRQWHLKCAICPSLLCASVCAHEVMTTALLSSHLCYLLVSVCADVFVRSSSALITLMLSVQMCLWEAVLFSWHLFYMLVSVCADVLVSSGAAGFAVLVMLAVVLACYAAKRNKSLETPGKH